VPCYREGERRERGELVLDEATQELGISKMTAIRLIQDKLPPARQACPGAGSNDEQVVWSLTPL
jgi:hypothetical protein